MAHWTAANIPNLKGRTAIVTGSTSGIGLEAARELARCGARVIIAARNPKKAEATVAAFCREMPQADLRFEQIDLGSLASVDGFAARIKATLPAVDILLNNAGLMMLPRRQETADGFERQFGTNHLGHFALTAALWPLLLASGAARVVTVASTAHRRGRLNLADLNLRTGYRATRAYEQSKLANLMFAQELARRIALSGAPIISVAAHPGLTATNLYATGQETGTGDPDNPRLFVRISSSAFRSIGMAQAKGALPLLYAATDPMVTAGHYYGPGGLGEHWGWPAKAKISAHARDREAAARLWQLSEEMTGRRFTATPA